MDHGHFFEDFTLGQHFVHPTPRTVSDGDSAVYGALTGSRVPTHSSAVLARTLGLRDRPLDDLLVFHIAFGKTVADISLHARANLGYAELQFLHPVFAGDTLSAESTVIGLKENRSSASGVVYVRSACRNQDGLCVLRWVRWVMVHKRDAAAPAPRPVLPALAPCVPAEQLACASQVAGAQALRAWCQASGSQRLWDDYAVGERIDHPCGMTLEEADHMSATRLYQNNARVHFDALRLHQAGGQRIVYGGHVISVCRALSYDGLENVVALLAINAGQHVAPAHAGDTLYASTRVLEKICLPGRADMGALRLRLVGLKNADPAQLADFTAPGGTRPHPAVVLDLDYVAALPRR